VVLLISVAFALIHGAVRYGWTGIVAFVVISLVVSNTLETPAS
jgi:type III secretory pathway component EscR